MVNISSGILIFFLISCLIALVVPFVKDGIVKELTIKNLMPGLGAWLVVILPLCLLFGTSALAGVPAAATLPCFIGAAILAYVLRRVGLPARLTGVLLGAAAVLLTILVPADNGFLMLASTLLGLLVTNVADSFMTETESRLDDILPAVFWLSGILWISSNQQGILATNCQNILLGIISVCLVLRVMQGPFMHDDRILLKRVILATSGALSVLIVITKLVLAMQFTQLSLLIGAGLFATYLFINVDEQGIEKVDGLTGLKLLTVIGMLELVAMRFWGMFGLVALAPIALVARRSGFAQFLGIFFCVRSLLQVFIATYNENVTGINIEHAYTGAALYAGLLAMAVLTLLLVEIKNRKLLAALFIGAGTFIPMVSNFYLHAEPTSSLLVAATVGAVIFAALGPAFNRSAKAVAGYENLLLVPAMMVAVGTTYGGLLEAGNGATISEKMTFIGIALAITIVAFLVWTFLNKTGKKSTGATTVN